MSDYCVPRLPLQVMIKREGHFSGELILTGRHYMFVPVPTEGDYLVEIRARAEGGDGPISRVRVSGDPPEFSDRVLRLCLPVCSLCVREV